jgi:hypothetical protein
VSIWLSLCSCANTLEVSTTTISSFRTTSKDLIKSLSRLYRRHMQGSKCCETLRHRANQNTVKWSQSCLPHPARGGGGGMRRRKAGGVPTAGREGGFNNSSIRGFSKIPRILKKIARRRRTTQKRKMRFLIGKTHNFQRVWWFFHGFRLNFEGCQTKKT